MPSGESLPDYHWARIGDAEDDAGERPYEFSIIRAEDNVRIGLLLLLMAAAAIGPELVTNHLVFYTGLIIGAFLSMWARYEADWLRLRRTGALTRGAVVVVLGDLAWLWLVTVGTGGLSSPFSALLVVPILYSVALFSRMRLAVMLVSAMVVLIYVTLAATSELQIWLLAGLLLTVMALGCVAHGVCQVLERERRTNELVIRNMSEGIVLLDCDRNVVVANRQLQRLTGVPTADMVGRNARDLADDDAMAPMDEVLRDVAEPTDGPATIVREVSVDLPDVVDLRVTTERCLGPAGERVGYVVVCQDVTPIKSVMRAKEAGLSMLTHEIRSPLTTLRVTASMLSALADGVSDGKVARFAEILDCETQRLVWIAGELLNASYFDDPRCELRRETCDVGSLVKRVCRVIALQASSKEISVAGWQKGDLSAVYVDEQRLQSALHRLCDNSLKYTEPGGEVTISAERIGDEVRISVSDTGKGIPEDKLDLIFEKFAQLEDASDRDKSERGTGLGLYVVRRIAELHGGHIEVDSEVGVGSTFSIVLPAVDPAMPKPAAPPAAELVAAK